MLAAPMNDDFFFILLKTLISSAFEVIVKGFKVQIGYTINNTCQIESHESTQNSVKEISAQLKLSLKLNINQTINQII